MHVTLFGSASIFVFASFCIGFKDDIAPKPYASLTTPPPPGDQKRFTGRDKRSAAPPSRAGAPSRPMISCTLSWTEYPSSTPPPISPPSRALPASNESRYSMQSYYSISFCHDVMRPLALSLIRGFRKERYKAHAVKKDTVLYLLPDIFICDCRGAFQSIFVFLAFLICLGGLPLPTV